MEVSKEDFQYVEGDDSVKFLRIVKNKKKRKFNIYSLTTLFHRELTEQKSAITFFIYHGLAGFCAVIIILGAFELTEDQLNWTGSLLPYLGVGALAIIFSLLISRLVIKIVSNILNLTLRMSRKNMQQAMPNNTEALVDFIKINRPNKTPFPQKLEIVD
jgi:hypothetical protein